MSNIIDFHSHVFPEKIAEKATVNIGKFYDMGMERSSGSVENLLKSGKEAGIGRFVVQSVATVANQTQSINRFIADECEKHEELIGLGTMHPDVESIEDEVEFIEKLGLRGIKLHPDFQTFNIDDRKAYPIYEIAQSKELFMLIHCGDYRYEYSHPKRLKKVLHDFPKLRIVAAHFGGWSVWDDAMELLRDENCFVDTSSTLGFVGVERTNKILHTFDTQRIVFGVDFPMWDHKKELELFMQLKLTDDQREDILYKNALRILEG